MFFLLALLLKYTPAEGKLYFEHLLGILDFSGNIYNLLIDFSFIEHVFLWVLPLKYTPAEGRLCFEDLLGILDFSENIDKIAVDISFSSNLFHWFFC